MSEKRSWKGWRVVVGVRRLYKLISVAGAPDDTETWWRALKWLRTKVVVPVIAWATAGVVDWSELMPDPATLIGYLGASAFTVGCIVAGVREVRSAHQRIRVADEGRQRSYGALKKQGTTKQPATRTWITKDAAFELISGASWIERHRPADDLDGLDQLATLRRRVGAFATLGDHLVAELAVKALFDFATEVPSGVNPDGLYSKELLTLWMVERSAATVGLYGDG